MPRTSIPDSLCRAGFTLVEMAIVLVVIALIIGGILVGQEIAHGAELNSVVADVNRIKASITTFKLKYTYWPGDMPNATSYWSGTLNGNGDSNVDYGGGWTAESELFRFWQHLSLSGILPGSYTGVTADSSAIATSVVPGSNMMASKLGGFYAVASGSDALHDTANRIGTWGANPYLFPFTPTDAKTIDSKGDDGRPGSGAITGSVFGTCSTGADLQSSVYALSRDDNVCGLYFWPGL